jgi:hypothetical protein
MSWALRSNKQNFILCPIYLNDSRKELIVSIKIDQKNEVNSLYMKGIAITCWNYWSKI